MARALLLAVDERLPAIEAMDANSAAARKAVFARRLIGHLACCATAILLCIARVATASTFVHMDEADLSARAHAVVLGWVTEIESGLDPTGVLFTDVHIAADEILAGALPGQQVVLRERGGTHGGRHEWIFGSPEYRVGEQVVVFVSAASDGSSRTTGMAMGKYRVTGSAAGGLTVTRTLGAGVAVLDSRQRRLRARPEAETQTLNELLAKLKRHGSIGGGAAAVSTSVSSLVLSEQSASFALTGSRWAEPDKGQPIPFLIDRSGDAAIGPAASWHAIVDALGAWSNIAGSSLLLTDGGPTEPAPWSGCDDGNRIVFGDPFDEIEDVASCRGQIALGGVCFFDFPGSILGGTIYRRIFQGKITFNNGLGDCPFWDECGLAEVAAHEIGHTIGLQHSTDPDSIMSQFAHFDGRCAALGANDRAAAAFLYPASAPTGPPTPTQTPTPATTQTPTPASTATRTATLPRLPVRIRGQVRYHAGARDEVAGATVLLSGRESKTVQTNAGGEYGFSLLPPGSWQIRVAKLGDDDAVTALDAARVLGMADARQSPSPLDLLACDVTGDGTVDRDDAQRILDLAVRRIDRLPVAEACRSEWVFLPDPQPLVGQEVSSPRTSGTCEPGRIMLDPLLTNADDQNFLGVLLGDCAGDWRSKTAVSPRAEDAPVRSTRQMLPGRRVRIRLDASLGAAHRAIEGQLRYDPGQLRPLRMRGGRAATDAIFTWNVPLAGQVRFAFASAAPLTGRSLIVVDFAVRDERATFSPVRVLDLRVDDAAARIEPGGAR